MTGVQFPNEQGDGQVGQVVVGGGDDGARGGGVGLLEHAADAGVADDDRSTQLAHGANESIAGVAFNDHDRFAIAQKFLDDTEPDGA